MRALTPTTIEQPRNYAARSGNRSPTAKRHLIGIINALRRRDLKTPQRSKGSRRWAMSLCSRRAALADAAPGDPEAQCPGRHRHAGFGLWLLSRREFVGLFYAAAYQARATVVGFNLPFDLSRLAVSWGAKRTGRFAGGHRLVLAEYERDDGSARETLWRPPIAIKTIDSKRALIGFLERQRAMR